MVRIDMSEYMEKHSVSRLVGAPPGYVGYEEGGQLTEAVRRRPYSVVLLDEIEKAHPDVFNVLLQVHGRRPAHRRPGPHRGLQEHRADHDLERRPAATRGRARAPSSPSSSTGSTRSSSSTRSTREEIGADRRPAGGERSPRRVHERGIEIELTDDARTLIGNLGYDPTYGARPLKRVIQKQLVDQLALALLRASSARATACASTPPTASWRSRAPAPRARIGLT